MGGGTKPTPKGGSFIDCSYVLPQTRDDNHNQEVLIQKHLPNKLQEDVLKNEKAARADDVGVPVKLRNEQITEKTIKILAQSI